MPQQVVALPADDCINKAARTHQQSRGACDRELASHRNLQFFATGQPALELTRCAVNGAHVSYNEKMNLTCMCRHHKRNAESPLANPAAKSELRLRRTRTCVYPNKAYLNSLTSARPFAQSEWLNERGARPADHRLGGKRRQLVREESSAVCTFSCDEVGDVLITMS